MIVVFWKENHPKMDGNFHHGKSVFKKSFEPSYMYLSRFTLLSYQYLSLRGWHKILQYWGLLKLLTWFSYWQFSSFISGSGECLFFFFLMTHNKWYPTIKLPWFLRSHLCPLSSLTQHILSRSIYCLYQQAVTLLLW